MFIELETFTNFFLVVCVSVFSVTVSSVFVMLIAMTITTQRNEIVRIQCYARVPDVCLVDVLLVMNLLRRSSAHLADVSVTAQDKRPDLCPLLGVVEAFRVFFRHVFALMFIFSDCALSPRAVSTSRREDSKRSKGDFQMSVRSLRCLCAHKKHGVGFTVLSVLRNNGFRVGSILSLFMVS